MSREGGRRRAVVVGAGPMGLEAALGLLERGFEVSVVERGRIGESLRRWGPSTRLFTPSGANLSARAKALLGASRPADDSLLSGPEMAERVLEPLASSDALAGRVRTFTRVVAVGRARLTRTEFVGHPLRAERPFRLLLDTPQGEECVEAEVVVDASGVYDQPTALGAGGLPAPGERAAAPGLLRHLGALEQRLPSLAGRSVLLVGHGHSAANAIALLAGLDPPPRLTWATRSPNRRPCLEVADDPLPERRAVVARANDLAAQPPEFLKVERRTGVEALLPRDGGLEVVLAGGRVGRFDAVVGLTGYRPDLSILSELALEIGPASEGPARLTRAIGHVTDCLTPPKVAPGDLESGEPGFHFVGAKSYGRLNTFLLETGRAHLERVLDLLGRGEA